MRLTGYKECLAAHDEDDLHGPELSHVELAAQSYGERKLHEKDEAEERDDNNGDDVVRRRETVEDLHLPRVDAVDAVDRPLDVHNSQGETNTDSHQTSEGAGEGNELLLEARHRAADDV